MRNLSLTENEKWYTLKQTLHVLVVVYHGCNAHSDPCSNVTRARYLMRRVVKLQMNSRKA